MSELETFYDESADFELPTDPVFGEKKITPLHIDIPLETRLTFVDKAELSNEWLGPTAITQKLGIYENWVYRRLKEFGIPSEERMKDGVATVVYPPFTVAVLKEELIWRNTFHALPQRIPFTTIAEHAGRSQGWTRKTMDEIGAKPTRSELDNGRVVELYPKGVLKTLRRISMAVPMDDDWLSMHRLTTIADVDWEWAARRLAEGGYEPQRRRSSLSGKIGDHFSSEALDYLQDVKAQRPQYGGEWMSANAMGELAGRNSRWMGQRLEKYKDSAEERQDDNGVTRLHYPPEVVAKVLQESETQRLLPQVEDCLSLRDLSRAVGHMATTTATILGELGIDAELRKDKVGRAGEYYPREVIDKIKEYDRLQEKSPQTTFLEITFAVGSLEARIRAIKGQLRTLKTFGEAASLDQVETLSQELAIRRHELKKAVSRYYRLANAS